MEKTNKPQTIICFPTKQTKLRFPTPINKDWKYHKVMFELGIDIIKF